jgi:hypothetical protein
VKSRHTDVLKHLEPCTTSVAQPQALARLVGWKMTPQRAGATDALLEVREEGCGGCGSGEAQAAGGAEEPALSSHESDERSAPELKREGHFCPSLPPITPSSVVCTVLWQSRKSW